METTNSADNPAMSSDHQIPNTDQYFNDSSGAVATARPTDRQTDRTQHPHNYPANGLHQARPLDLSLMNQSHEDPALQEQSTIPSSAYQPQFHLHHMQYQNDIAATAHHPHPQSQHQQHPQQHQQHHQQHQQHMFQLSAQHPASFYQSQQPFPSQLCTTSSSSSASNSMNAPANMQQYSMSQQQQMPYQNQTSVSTHCTCNHNSWTNSAPASAIPGHLASAPPPPIAVATAPSHGWSIPPPPYSPYHASESGPLLRVAPPYELAQQHYQHSLMGGPQGGMMGAASAAADVAGPSSADEANATAEDIEDKVDYFKRAIRCKTGLAISAIAISVILFSVFIILLIHLS